MSRWPEPPQAARGPSLRSGSGVVGAMRMPSLIVLFAVLLMPVLLLPGCGPRPDGLSPEARAYLDRRMLEPPPSGMTLDAAYARQRALVAELAPHLGGVAGYKAAYVNPAIQKRFNIPSPVRGALYRDGLLADGAVVDAAFGAVPLVESDTLVRVKSARINQARTPAEVLAEIDGFIPFIELPDNLIPMDAAADGAARVAHNCGSRMGVMGALIPIPADASGEAMLAAMTVANEIDGVRGASAPASVLMGHPLRVVLWLVQDLAARGESLRAGDLVSLGGMHPPSVPRPGMVFGAIYEGLPGGPHRVHVRFR